MKMTDKLQIINSESDIQSRIRLLVAHDFKSEASQLIRDMARMYTAMLHYDWHDQDFCHPLPRVTNGRSAVYVIITTSSKLDYHPARKENNSHIIFELGWERKALGWTEEESRQLLHTILAQALARPINQWSLKQAEGTGRATRRLLPANNPIAREIAALHLVFHLREADFGHISNFLGNMEGYPFASSGMSKSLNEEESVNWIVEQLLALGWTSDRIRKELVEWIWLKTGTWPQWLLAVARAKVFDENDQVRTIAVRRWVNQGFDYLLESVSGRSDNRKMAETYRQLFRLGQFDAADETWMLNKLVQQMASGNVSSVKWFFAEFAETLGFDQLDQTRDRAIEVAKAAGNYSIVADLIKDGGKTPDPELMRIVKIRSLPMRIK